MQQWTAFDRGENGGGTKERRWEEGEGEGQSQWMVLGNGEKSKNES